MNAFFVFSGQGAQSVGMGKDLAEKSPKAAAIFEEANQVLSFDLRSIIFDGPAEKLTETNYCQTAIYTMSCAALEAFKEIYDVNPIGCAGLSLGEYSALYASGAFSFADGLKLLAKRAELMDKACKSSNGAMASVLGGDLAIIREVCAEKGIDVANYNSPTQTVISGEKELLTSAVDELKARGIRKVIVLNVAGAFHSRLMAPAAEALSKEIGSVKLLLPSIPTYHNYTADVSSSESELKDNLINQIANSVRWEECVRKLVALGGDTMIEFGPGNVLTGLVKRSMPELKIFNINNVETLQNFNS